MVPVLSEDEATGGCMEPSVCSAEAAGGAEGGGGCVVPAFCEAEADGGAGGEVSVCCCAAACALCCGGGGWGADDNGLEDWGAAVGMLIVPSKHFSMSAPAHPGCDKKGSAQG